MTTNTLQDLGNPTFWAALTAQQQLLELSQAVAFDFQLTHERPLTEHCKDQHGDLSVVETLAQRVLLAPQTPEQPAPTSAAITDIAAERRRQIEEEGWSAQYDDKYTDGELPAAAAAYALHAAGCGKLMVGHAWPWDKKWWKPTTPRRDLIKAGALIAAEVERRDRASQKGANT